MFNSEIGKKAKSNQEFNSIMENSNGQKISKKAKKSIVAA